MIKQTWITQSVSESRASDVEGVGSLRVEGSKAYRWVKNSALDIDFVSGDVVCYHPYDMLKQIAKSSVTTMKLMAGVVASTTLERSGVEGNHCYGWVQVLGVHDAVQVSSEGYNHDKGEYFKAVHGQVYAVEDTAVPPAYKALLQLVDSLTSAELYATKKCCISCL